MQTYGVVATGGSHGTIEWDYLDRLNRWRLTPAALKGDCGLIPLSLHEHVS